VIGVIPRPDQVPFVEEFFELFKTPWEFLRPGRRYDVAIVTGEAGPDIDAKLVLVFGPESNAPTLPGPPGDGDAVGVVVEHAESRRTIRLGYDLFDQVRSLLVDGQPVERAHIPTLDLHVSALRQSILRAGIPLLEIPPAPAGHGFAICLTHDIDFVGIKRHGLDHSVLGFLYRSTVGSIRDLIRRRIAVGRALRMWRAAASLPFVMVGWAKDFWEPFEWYLRVEANLPATYYVIPFKGRPGVRAAGNCSARRATAYDVSDLGDSSSKLLSSGCELGVHGIDSWHSVGSAVEERARVADTTGAPVTGIRMHWLLRDEHTPEVLDRAGYDYDSTLGYNETVGFRNGTTQAFRPVGAKRLLELPMHIQDGALFFPDRLDSSETEAWARCAPIIEHAERSGGVVTLLWHDRSHGPERFWGEFYARLVGRLKASTGWFATAADVIAWFRKRRAVRFGFADEPGAPVSLSYDGDVISPPLTIRFHQPSAGNQNAGVPASVKTIDVAWDGRAPFDRAPYFTNETALSLQ
jgi:hypothetical protein